MTETGKAYVVAKFIPQSNTHANGKGIIHRVGEDGAQWDKNYIIQYNFKTTINGKLKFCV